MHRELLSRYRQQLRKLKRCADLVSQATSSSDSCAAASTLGWHWEFWLVFRSCKQMERKGGQRFLRRCLQSTAGVLQFDALRYPFWMAQFVRW